jgi:phosphoserine aminotransferase
MNVPFRVGSGSEKLEDRFVREAYVQGLVELKGHKAVGGCRASMYNAMPVEGVQRLITFMKQFRDENERKATL